MLEISERTDVFFAYIEHGDFFFLIMKIVPAISYAVILSWIMLRAKRSWRSEPSWIDRMGRSLGIVWVAGLPFYYWLSVLK